MEVKIRNIDRDIIDKLNESAASFGISREELLRKIIDQFINEQDLKKNPLTTIIKENNIILEEIKYQLIRLSERINVSEESKNSNI